MDDLFLAFASAFFGGIAAAVTGLIIYNQQRRENITQKYIDEFLSDSMLRHRIVAGKIHQRLRSETRPSQDDQDPFSIERLARGFWNAGPTAEYSSYKGPTDPHTGLNEHQSLEAILQYISRLVMNIERRNIYLADYKLAVHDSYIWLYQVLDPLEKEIKRQADEHRKMGGTVKGIHRINRLRKLKRLLEIPHEH